MELRPYQIEAIDAARRELSRGPGCLVVIPTGGGKSLVMAKIAAACAAKGGRTLIVAHRKRLIRQTAQTCAKIGMHPSVDMAGEKASPLSDVVVASVQTLASKKRRERFPADHFRLIIVDECFPGNTPIDGRPIRSIRPGDTVSSFNPKSMTIEPRRVLRVMSRQYCGPWYRITSSCGRAFVCTENHPVWVYGHGYVPAKDLTALIGSCIMVHDQHLRDLWGEISEPKILRRQKGQENVLAGMLAQNALAHHGEDQSDLRCGSHESEKSHVEGWGCGKDGGEKTRTAILGSSRREWSRANQAAGDFVFCPGELPDGDGHPYQDAARSRLSLLLQGRSRHSIGNVGHRDRRRDASRKAAPTGCQEGQVFGVSRLEGVEVYQSGCGSRPAWVPDDDRVYNLHVDETNCYFANGILVHNCHHYSDGKLTASLTYFKAKFLGFTATPNRADRKPITGLFPSLAYEVGLMELIEDQFLAPIRIEPMPLGIDVSGVKKKGGDFDEGELDCAIRPYLRRAAEELATRAAGRRTIAFLPLISTSRDFAEVCREVGLRADFISGQCPEDRQDEVQAAFARGELDVLANAQILTEGVDLPICDCVLPLRPTQSQPLFSQMVGRGTRLFPGKKDLLLLDPMFLHEKMNLMEPACLTATSDRHMAEIRKLLAKGADLKTATAQAEKKIIEDDAAAARAEAEKAQRKAEREAQLAARLEAASQRKGHIRTLSDLVPLFGASIERHYDRHDWQRQEPTAQQLECLRNAGYPIEMVTSKGLAAHLITAMHNRRERKLCTLKQFKVLAQTGHPNAAGATFQEANEWISNLSKRKA